MTSGSIEIPRMLVPRAHQDRMHQEHTKGARMNIGLIGTGSMSQTLGRLWQAAGHQLCIGSRSPDKAAELAGSLNASVRAGTFAQAAAFGDVLLLAVHNAAVFDVLAGLGDLRGRIVIDCNNPFDPASGLVLSAYQGVSMAEQIAQHIPGAHVVKAYNTIPSVVLAKSPPRVGSNPTTAFVAGDDAAARTTVMQLSRDAQLQPVDCGPLNRARLLEAAAVLAIDLIFSGMGGNIALNLAHES
jgi:predicted dinucleotide-binding enzyme